MRGALARVRSLWRGVRRRADVEAEMAEEFRLHQQLRTADLVGQGLTPAEAVRQLVRPALPLAEGDRIVGVVKDLGIVADDAGGRACTTPRRRGARGRSTS